MEREKLLGTKWYLKGKVILNNNNECALLFDRVFEITQIDSDDLYLVNNYMIIKIKITDLGKSFVEVKG